MPKILLVIFLFTFIACSSSVKQPVVFDVPKIMTLRDDEVSDNVSGIEKSDELTEAQKDNDVDKVITFTQGAYAIDLTFSPISRALKSAFIYMSDDRNVDVDGLDSLRAAGNLDSLSDHFFAKHVSAAGETSKYTGFLITTTDQAYKNKSE